MDEFVFQLSYCSNSVQNAFGQKKWKGYYVAADELSGD